LRATGTGGTLGGTFSNVDVTGSYTTVGNVSVTGTLSVTGAAAALTLGSKVTVTGNLTVTAPNTSSIATAASLVLNDQRLDVGGTAFYNHGRLISTLAGDTLSVAGNYTVQGTFGGASTNGVMTDGVLKIGGNFTQTGAALSFAASAGHKSLFNGTVAQTINFEDPSATGSRFGILEITNTAGASAITMATNVFALGQVVVGAGVTPTISAGGNTLTVGGFNVNGVIFDNMPLVLVNGSVWTLLDNFVFQNMASAAIQLDIRRDGPGGGDVGTSGGSATFDDINIATGSGGRYLSVTNTNATPSVTVNVFNPTPVSGSPVGPLSATAGTHYTVGTNAAVNWDAA
jgi:hypothetical protein